MHVLAVFLLFAFGVMALTMFVHHAVSHDHASWHFTASLVGVATAWLTGFSMWSSWHVHMRYDWVGITMTGLALAGTATFFHTVMGFFSGLDRKFHDQAKVLETHDLKKVKAA